MLSPQQRAQICLRAAWCVNPNMDGLKPDNEDPYPGRAETKSFCSLTYRLQRDAELDRQELLAELDRLDPSTQSTDTITKLMRVLDAVGLQSDSAVSYLEDMLDMLEPKSERIARKRNEIRSAYITRHKRVLATRRKKTGWDNEPTSKRKAFSLYETPDDLADSLYARVFALWKAPRVLRMLEPSVGRGSLVEGYIRYIGKQPDQLTVCDVLPENVTHIKRKRWRCETHTCNFLDITPIPHDLVVGNPPFNRFEWLPHLLHAAKFVSKGGCLAFIIPRERTLGALAREYARLKRDFTVHEYNEENPAYTLLVLLRK